MDSIRKIPTIKYQNNFSIKEARKILGKESKQLSDTQIQIIITTLVLLARDNLCYNSSNKALGKNNE